MKSGIKIKKAGVFILFFLFFLPQNTSAQLKLFLGYEKKELVITDYLISDRGLFWSLDESASVLDLDRMVSPDGKFIFIKLEESLIIIDVEQAKGAIGKDEFNLFSAPIKTDGRYYLPKDFFEVVLSKALGIPIKIEKLGMNYKVPEKFGLDPVDIVVIDPGHGGESSGAITTSGIKEKDLTLKLAKMLKNRLSMFSGLKVYLTRDSDITVGLDERAQFANNLNADLFLSIHANASPKINVQGVETFFLSLKASDELSRKLALLENLGINLAESGVLEQGSNNYSDIELILGDMAQTEHLESSQAFAEIVQDHLTTVMKTENRGVKQAPFRVLMGANMPAVLVEVGFITNHYEEKLITDPSVQEKIVKALADSVIEFKEIQAKKLGIKGIKDTQKNASSKKAPSGSY